MKKTRVIILLVFIVTLAGCDPVGDIKDVIASLFTDYLPDITCWLWTLFTAFLNVIFLDTAPIIVAALGLLPQVTLPTITSQDLGFLSYVAFFLPIAEGATLVKYFVGFWLSFFLIRWAGRWLKVWK